MHSMVSRGGFCRRLLKCQQLGRLQHALHAAFGECVYVCVTLRGYRFGAAQGNTITFIRLVSPSGLS